MYIAISRARNVKPYVNKTSRTSSCTRSAACGQSIDTVENTSSAQPCSAENASLIAVTVA